MSSAPNVGHSVASSLGYSLTPSKTEPFAVCPAPKPGESQCMAVVDPTAATRSQAEAEALLGLGPEPAASPSLEGTGEEGGFTSAEIRKAYGIPETGGKEPEQQTVAVVDAYNDPDAESDLQKYRETYKVDYKGTETACTEANKCFKKLDQTGETEKEAKEKSKTFPGNEPGWSQEISLDLDMVSAVCPECKILLVEATNNKENAEQKVPNLDIAEDEAVALKATEISNSWDRAEFSGETSADTYFNHAGIPITVAAGDHGYGVSYPAASPDVISVGGTTLKKTKEGSRGWEESVWSGSGSGCSVYEKSKPEWQHDPGCANRTDNDVAAVANPNSPVSVYDSYAYEGHQGWLDFGGTSVATPIVAAVEAHASKAVREEPRAEAFYRHVLFDVTAGSNAPGCHSYLCSAGEGYDGPTGWGTPDGPLELSAGFHAVTTRATGVSVSGATLNGYVNPEGKETTYKFEYGKTTSYGTSIPVPNSSVGSGVTWKAVSQSITGLAKETTYHYRLVATRGVETIHGADHTFATALVSWVAQPNPSGEAPYDDLANVSCSSATACTAVGIYSEEGNGENSSSLAERWNGTEWRIQSVPNPTNMSKLFPDSWLTGVSCSSATACTAVGYYYPESGGRVTLAEYWNGTEWQVQTTPNPTGEEYSELSGVSCSSSAACTAVGDYDISGTVKTLAEAWNGTEWKIQSTPNSPSGWGELLGVSCSSSSACVAVGSGRSPATTLAEYWNGTEWKIQSTPNPTGEWSELKGVSCRSSTACTAVGDYDVSGTVKTLAEVWNGTEWKIQTTPNPAGAVQNSLSAVSCSSATACTAVGSDESEPVFAERWNGTEWTLQAMPVANETGGRVGGVSCTSPHVCIAVGQGGDHALLDRESLPVTTTEAVSGMTGSEATLNGTVNPEESDTHYHFEYGTTTSYGTSVPVPEADIGSGATGVKVSQVIASLTAGTTYHFRLVASNVMGTTSGEDRTFKAPIWRITATPNPTGTLNSYLWGVSCNTTSACTAVGGYDTTGASEEKPVAERWNGSSWSVQTPPEPSKTETAELYATSCGTTSYCLGVGTYEKGGVYFALADLWFNGIGWAELLPPEPAGSLNGLLRGTSCTAATTCMAVGWYEPSLGVEAAYSTQLVESKWTVKSMPDPSGAKWTHPVGVSCTSSAACTMTGSYESSSGSKLPFAERWNGTEWALQSVPVPSEAVGAEVGKVSCVSASSCTTVGDYWLSKGGPVKPLAEHWNGSGWTIQSVPAPSETESNSLSGVSCTSTTVCMAIGSSRYTGSSYSVPLAEQWNGTEWLAQKPPSSEEKNGLLDGGVACVNKVWCAAVGNTGKTFVEMYR